MGLDIEGEDFHDIRVMKSNCEIGEAVKMDWSITKTGFNGS